MSRVSPDVVPGPATSASGRIRAAAFQNGGTSPSVSDSNTARSWRDASAAVFVP